MKPLNVESRCNGMNMAAEARVQRQKKWLGYRKIEWEKKGIQSSEWTNKKVYSYVRWDFIMQF